MAKQWKSGKNLEGARSAVRACMWGVDFFRFFFFFLVSVFSCRDQRGGGTVETGAN